MTSNYNELLCYKKTDIDSHGKLKFFLEKHSTKEGTWAKLALQEGAIDFVFLNGQGQELSRITVNQEQPEVLIPPLPGTKSFLPVNRLRQLLSFIACLNVTLIKNTDWPLYIVT